ncbi:AMP-binding protein [Kocuria sp. CPCC 205268]|uniref:AMP-binding protein n=1 Tax=Kocuria oxytropis TaxID=3058913 RepID=UPI0034D46185
MVEPVPTSPMSDAAPGVSEQYEAVRDRVLELREDYDRAREEFRWPRMEHFNFALDWFDHVARDPERGARDALWIVGEDGTELRRTFRDLSGSSDRTATWLRGLGVRRGDRVLLMLGNRLELWETQLAGMKLGAPLIPTAVMMPPADLQDRVQRGKVSWVVTDTANAPKFAGVEGDYELVVVGPAEEAGAVRAQLPGRAVHLYAEAAAADAGFVPEGVTRSRDPLLLYFTSGTTSQAKLVEHTHYSYSFGHLSTVYWMGLRPGDVHLNIASPGWGKHSWSNFFAPWIAEATVFIYNQHRFDAPGLMEQMSRAGVTSFCAPPTVWRMLIQADLHRVQNPPLSVVSAGEPLNPEVIRRVQEAWGVTIRDGYGQTETTLQIANTPGQPVEPGAMGRPLPGFVVELFDPRTGAPAEEGEICLKVDDDPPGIMAGYIDEPERTAEVVQDGWYHTRDIARRDERGVYTYVGRTDDVFKASDYRISPFELESVLIEHPAVAEAAVVPAPDPVRHAVPKAYLVLAAGAEPTRELAGEILRFARENLAPYQRVRRVEFTDLPKTISGKIRRVVLREREEAADRSAPVAADGGYGVEYTEADFPGLRD